MRLNTSKGSFVLPEGSFRYVALSRAGAYAAHDGQCVAIMEWPTADQPLEPGEVDVKSDFDALRLARKATS
jgi:hypothetical protein